MRRYFGAWSSGPSEATTSSAGFRPTFAPARVARTRQAPYPWRMFRGFLVAAVVVLALASSGNAVPSVAKTNQAVLTHKLIVAVKKNVAPAVEKKLAVLVL